ncbi:hypothetical protein C1645_738015 [Glomus cerebriforme]|uniref:Replication origin-binding protein domain-containing protein n=1 Tax=Glomus cerebriforme TaxID=658196 RepID=A0A397SZX6_9GLOM|nr:hypothetical protein C1645_738015 [Glomus cerebriforme]
MFLAQKKPGSHPKTINEATRLFSDLADLDYEPGYNDHVYFQYLSNNKNDISLLGAYHPEEVYSKYIIWVARKDFTVVDHPFEVYGFSDTYECIDRNLPFCLVLDINARQYSDLMNPELPSLDKYKISCEDLLSRILIACTDIINSDLNHFIILDVFALASSSNANKCIQLKSNYSEIWSRIFSFEKLKKEEFQLIEDETALSKRADLVIAKYEWFEIELSEKVINVKMLKDVPESYPDFLNSEKTTTLIHSSLATWKTITLREIIMALKDKVKSLFRVEFTTRPFVAILDEINAIMHQMSSGTNIRESENALHDVLRSVRHVVAMDTFANKSTLAFLKTYRSEDIHIINNRYQPRVSETVEILYDLNSGTEAIRIGCELLKQEKCVAFISTEVVMARALVEKTSKLVKSDNSPIRARAYYGDMDGKQ